MHVGVHEARADQALGVVVHGHVGGVAGALGRVVAQRGDKAALHHHQRVRPVDQRLVGIGGEGVVAEGEGAILGYASVRTSLSSEDEKDEIPYTYAHVDDLAVLASARSKGVGAALLDACEDLARAAGQRWLRLGVLAANERARAFYARQGYGEILLTLEKRL